MIYLNENGKYINMKAEDALKNEFLIFLSEKPVEKISVSELCRKMNINRSTFYSHYVDIYDLLNSVKEDLLKELDNLSNQIIEDRNRTAETVTKSVFDFIYKNRILLKYEFVLTKDQEYGDLVNKKVQKLFYDTMSQDYPHFKCIDKVELESTLAFLSYGYYAIYRKWLSNDCMDNTNNMAKIAINVTEKCMEAFEEQARVNYSDLYKSE